MKIQRLTLKDFRNLQSCELNPGEEINILYGDNGQGKTNLLESIYFLSHLSPLSPTPQKNMIRFGTEYSRVFGQIRCGELSRELSVHLCRKNKTVQINGKRVSRSVDYFGELAVILFSPESMKVVHGAPEQRRRFLDTAISRWDRRYLYDLKEYKKVLEQRNRLLRLLREGRFHKETLQAWNEQLVSTGSRILQTRFRYLREASPICAEVFRTLYHKEGTLRIFYQSTLFRRSGIEDTVLEGSEIETCFRKGIERVEKREIETGASKVGPHLDDLFFQLEGHSAKSFASQGEKRVLALSLTLGEALFYRQKTGLFPILLLDDVNSELDHRHQAILGEHLMRLGQVFLTTTDDEIYRNMVSNPRKFRVQKGEIFLVNDEGK